MASMSRPLRIEVTDGIHHVWCRGNDKQSIYVREADHRRFLRELETTIEKFEWACLSYALMGNHYHLLLRTPKANLSRGMQRLNGVYAQRLLKREERCGHLFQSRFRSSLVERGDYLLRVLRYIARNPVKAGLCNHAEEWPWGSTRTILEPSASTFVAVDEVLRLFGETPEEARRRFREFIGSPCDDHDDAWTETPIVGSADFVRTHQPGNSASKEIPFASRFVVRPSLGELLGSAAGDADIARAVLDFGYTRIEVAAHLGVHRLTVGRFLRRWQAGQRAAAEFSPEG